MIPRNGDRPVSQLTAATGAARVIIANDNLTVSLPETGDRPELIMRKVTLTRSVCADGQKLHARPERGSQTNDRAARPVPQKVATAYWSRRPSTCCASREGGSGTRQAQRAPCRAVAHEWLRVSRGLNINRCWPVVHAPGDAVMRVRDADTSRPGATVMGRAATWPTRVLRPSGTCVPTPDQCPGHPSVTDQGAGHSPPQLPSGTGLRIGTSRTDREYDQHMSNPQQAPGCDAHQDGNRLDCRLCTHIRRDHYADLADQAASGPPTTEPWNDIPAGADDDPATGAALQQIIDRVHADPAGAGEMLDRIWTMMIDPRVSIDAPEQAAKVLAFDSTMRSDTMLYADGVGVGFAAPAANEAWPEWLRPMVSLCAQVRTAMAHKDSPGYYHLSGPFLTAWSMPFWMAGAMHGSLEAMRESFPPELQERWDTERQRQYENIAQSLASDDARRQAT